MGLFSRKDKPSAPPPPQSPAPSHQTKRAPASPLAPHPSRSPAYASPSPSEPSRRAFGPRAPRELGQREVRFEDGRATPGARQADGRRRAEHNHARGGSVDQISRGMERVRIDDASRGHAHGKSASVGGVVRQAQSAPGRSPAQSVSPQAYQQASLSGPRLPGQKPSMQNIRERARPLPPSAPSHTAPAPPPHSAPPAPCQPSQQHQSQQQARHTITQPASAPLAQQLANAARRPLPPSTNGSSAGSSAHPSTATGASRYSNTSSSSTQSRAPAASWTTEGAPPRLRSNHPHPHSYAADAPRLRPFAQTLPTPRVPGQPLVSEHPSERAPAPFGQVIQTPLPPRNGFEGGGGGLPPMPSVQRVHDPTPPAPQPAQVQGRRLVSEGSAGGLPGAFAPSWNAELPTPPAWPENATGREWSPPAGGGAGGGMGMDTPWMNAHRPPPRNQMPYFAPPAGQEPLPPPRPPLPPQPRSERSRATEQQRPTPPPRPATFGVPPSAQLGPKLAPSGVLQPTVPSPAKTPPGKSPLGKSKGATPVEGNAKARKASGKLAYLDSSESDYSDEDAGSIIFLDDKESEDEGTTAVAKLLAKSARSKDSSPQKSTPSKSSPASKGRASPGGARHQCSGTTASGRRCTRLVEAAAGTPTKCARAELDPLDAMLRQASEGGAEAAQVGRFCFQHTSHALSERGCFVHSQVGGGGADSVWVEYSDWIPEDLPTQTRVMLRGVMAQPVSARDEEGYIYVHELVERRKAGASGARTTLLKVGRSVRPAQRLSQWRSQCPSREPIVRAIYPLGQTDQGSSMPRSTLSFAEVGTRNHHRWERLILIEVAGRAALECGLDPKEGRGECSDCGARHQELFEVAEGAWEEWAKEVVERWGRWCAEVLG